MKARGSIALCVALGLAALLPTLTQAAVNRPFQANFALNGIAKPGPFQDACGLATDSAGDIYVSDYYADAIDVYRPNALGTEVTLLTQIDPVEPIDGPCGLAVDAAGRLYVNVYHRSVLRYTPSQFPPQIGTTYGAPATIDEEHPTGLALDPDTGTLFVDERTQIAEYAAPLTPGQAPTQLIGKGSIEDGYGLAVSDFAASDGYLYVADASTNEIEVFDPETDTTNPIESIAGQGTPQGGFHFLEDSALAIEQSTGHLLVLDNLQPGFDEPGAVVDEFNAKGAYRGQLPHAIVHALPSGIAPYSGGLYVTSGAGALSVLYAFGPAIAGRTLEIATSGTGEGSVKSNPAGIACPSACQAEYDIGATVSVTASAKAGSAFAGWTNCPNPSGPGGINCTMQMNIDREVGASFEALPVPPGAVEGPSAPEAPDQGPATALGASAPSRDSAKARPAEATASEVTQRGKLRVAFEGALSPHALPRKGAAPIRVSVGVKVSTADGSQPPQMRQIAIAINRNGHFETKGLPRCPLSQIQPTTTADALAACRSALVGRGSFQASVSGSGQSPFPSQGTLYAFNSTVNGRPAILAHVYGTKPLPTSFTLVFELKPQKGTFGTVLSAKLPDPGPSGAYITGIELDLGRNYRSHGQRRSYLSAGCPAPKGFGGASFPFARASLDFAGGRGVNSTLTRSCGVRG